MATTISPEQRWKLITLFNTQHYAVLEQNVLSILDEDSECAFAWQIYGAALEKQGRNGLDALRKSAELTPEDPGALCNLGNALRDHKEFEEAVTNYQRALALWPEFAMGHCGLGLSLRSLGRTEEALAHYHSAIQLKPDYAEAYNNLANALQATSKLEGAISNYRRALAIKPDYSEIYANLGRTLQDNGREEEAVESFLLALTYNNGSLQAHGDAGNALIRTNQFDEAILSFKRAAVNDPSSAAVYNNYGNCLQALGQFQDAIGYYQRALAINPNLEIAYNCLMMNLQYEQLLTREQMLIEHRRFGEQFETALKAQWKPHTNRRDPDKRLKIGYVSGDFCWHAVSYFIEPAITEHDRTQVEVYCYATNSKHDKFTDRLIAEADHWISCADMTEDQMAERIRADGIDILVDLAGHTADNRLLVFARKPAPIQFTYLGYPGTTGLTAIDYRLTDNYTEPEDAADPADSYYTEKLLRLPNSIWCYSPDDAEITPLPALQNGYITFGSFNNIKKVGAECIALWAKLLHHIPSSRLLMVTVSEGSLRDQLTRQFGAHGIAAERLEFAPKMPTVKFRKKLQEVDITLDPFPVNGATTTCESLVLGVPVLAMVGERFLARAGYSILNAAEMPEFVAKNEEDFLRIAGELANDLPRLAQIRAEMREKLFKTPLLDRKLFARNLETAFRNTWHHYVSTNP
jgi:predicted O-linked N-acetylglucosamine transferase (SPINDLY family)